MMDRLKAYQDWWQPLPAWRKLVTACGICPAWLFIVYCVFTGESKSRAALLAFGVFMIGTLVHIACDRRNRGSSQERDGIDFSGGE